MNAVLREPPQTYQSPLVDRAPYNALVPMPAQRAKRLKDAPHPLNNEECAFWADKFRSTNDPRWFDGIRVAAALLALKLFYTERNRTMDETYDRGLNDYLREEAKGIQALVVADALELCASWVPERGALGTWLHKPIIGTVRDAFSKSREVYCNEAQVKNPGTIPAERDNDGNYKTCTRDGSMRAVGKHSDPTPRGVRFRDEPELASLIKQLAVGLYDDLDYYADERAVLFHILIPQAHGDAGLTDGELADKLGRPRLWVLRKRHQLLAEMRQALAEAGVAE